MRLGVLRRVLAVGALVVTGALAPTTPAHAGSNRAVIVIGNSTYTVSFSGTISGLQALRMVASVETLHFGGQLGDAVCKINGVGNAPTAGTCLVGPGGAYWRYFRAAPGASGWSYSSTGASGTTVTDGSVEGWYYGASGSPPFHSFCSVAGCGPPPPPVTTAPTAAPGTTPTSPPGGGTTDPSAPDDAPSTANETTATSTGTSRDDDADDPDRQASGAPAGGKPEIGTSDADDDGSPVGMVVAGGVVIALGGTGMWLRRRRRVTT